MFYPDIVRRITYATKTDGSYYSSYDHYRGEISEDCDYRCVYCDITEEEQGGEGMQLDHFKPQELFGNLHNNPTNLVLACPKCNRLKSDHWPLDVGLGLNGFLDPFSPDRTKWYQIKSCGAVEDNNSHATALTIEILRLNRPARVQIRRKRLIEKRIADADERLNEKLYSLKSVIASDEMDQSRMQEVLDEIISLKGTIDTLREL